MFKHSGKIGVVILYFYIIKFGDARSSSDLNSIRNADKRSASWRFLINFNGFYSGNSIDNDIDSNKAYDNNVDSDEPYDNDDNPNEDVCELSKMPPAPDSNCCGIDVSMNDRIVGGAPTQIKQYPWLALIEYAVRGSNLLQIRCGGSLISSLYVLTAYHCVEGEIVTSGSKPVNVILGDYDKYHAGPDCLVGNNGEMTCNDGELRISIASITPHKSYNPTTKNNDIALIKLMQMAPYTDFIRPICLPTSDLTMTIHENLWFTAAGWGVMRQILVGYNYTKKIYMSETSAFKQHTNLLYVPLQQCHNMTNWAITENQICAMGIMGQNVCSGDSGGPLMFNNDGQFELVGVSSATNISPCEHASNPGIFTNVFKYYDWIMNVIENK